MLKNSKNLLACAFTGVGGVRRRAIPHQRSLFLSGSHDAMICKNAVFGTASLTDLEFRSQPRQASVSWRNTHVWGQTLGLDTTCIHACLYGEKRKGRKNIFSHVMSYRLHSHLSINCGVSLGQWGSVTVLFKQVVSQPVRLCCTFKTLEEYQAKVETCKIERPRRKIGKNIL